MCKFFVILTALLLASCGTIREERRLKSEVFSLADSDGLLVAKVESRVYPKKERSEALLEMLRRSTGNGLSSIDFNSSLPSRAWVNTVKINRARWSSFIHGSRAIGNYYGEGEIFELHLFSDEEPEVDCVLRLAIEGSVTLDKNDILLFLRGEGKKFVTLAAYSMVMYYRSKEININPDANGDFIKSTKIFIEKSKWDSFWE